VESITFTTPILLARFPGVGDCLLYPNPEPEPVVLLFLVRISFARASFFLFRRSDLRRYMLKEKGKRKGEEESIN
jgi:hypothetical protein